MSNVRPTKLSDFIGQENIVKQVNIAVKSAKAKDVPFPHMAMGGPPGLGKTTLAKIVANEMEGELVSRIASAITTPEDLVQLFSQIQDLNTIIFLDEIEQLDRHLTELLHTALEDGVFTAKLGSGETVSTELPEFTLVGATNYLGELPHPFIDRFRIQVNFEPYDCENIYKIIVGAVKKMQIKTTKDAAQMIATRSRGVPRVAIRYLENALDVALAYEDKYHKTITTSCVKEMLNVHRIDDIGLTELDRRILKFLMQNEKPVGLKTLSQGVDEDKSTIEFSEGYMVRLGFINKTAKGRIITDKGKQHLEGLKT